VLYSLGRKGIREVLGSDNATPRPDPAANRQDDTGDAVSFDLIPRSCGRGDLDFNA
jgi:hypothetical protein